MRGETRRGRRRSGAAPDARFEARLCRDLEARGVAPAASRRVAARIAARAVDLSEDAYAAFLDGVAAAGGETSPPDSGPAPAGQASAREIQRLFQDFAVELKKLDEGLRLLSTYLLRIRDRTTQERPRTIH